ncbi:MAG TPA: hypothetical protein VM582_02830 [Candidatus Thermoplasmatota archaeon]|nr:hypothetical protein [Candidatus Thermoplasmatota archaeon]
MVLPLLVAVDLASAAGTMLLAGAFGLLWARSRVRLHLLFSAAFATLAVGLTTVGASAFEVVGSGGWLDALRIVCHTAAPVMLVTGYWLAQEERRLHALVIVALSLGVAAALAAGLWAVASFSGAADTRRSFLVAHAIQFALYLALVVLSGRNFVARPTWRRAFVPLAFISYAFSKYTWLIIDLDGDLQLVPLVYAWRILTIGLLLAALLAPFLRGVSDGPP